MYWASVLLDYYYTSLENILPIVNQQNFSNVVLSSIIIDGKESSRSASDNEQPFEMFPIWERVKATSNFP